MTDASGFAKFVPGFDFLQSLVNNAGAALPNVGQWIVPTLDPEELDKRINELRTVQFWLDQNARMLATTIQALEVQRMTLSTLRGMNVSLNDLQSGLTARSPSEPPPSPSSKPAREPAGTPAAAADGEAETTTADAAPQAPAVDPMQWWGALTQQFSTLAADAMRQAAQAAAPVAAAAQQATQTATTAAQAAAQAAKATAGTSSDAGAPHATPAARAAKAPVPRKASPARKVSPKTGAGRQQP